jgi:hypothetical protein
MSRGTAGQGTIWKNSDQRVTGLRGPTPPHWQRDWFLCPSGPRECLGLLPPAGQFGISFVLQSLASFNCDSLLKESIASLCSCNYSCILFAHNGYQQSGKVSSM